MYSWLKEYYNQRDKITEGNNSESLLIINSHLMNEWWFNYQLSQPAAVISSTNGELWVLRNTHPASSYFHHFTGAPCRDYEYLWVTLPSCHLSVSPPNRYELPLYSASIPPCLPLHSPSFQPSSLYPQHLQRPPYSCATSGTPTTIAPTRNTLSRVWTHTTDCLDEETPFTT